MAKLTSFLRRILTSITSDDEHVSSESRRSIVIIPSTKVGSPITPQTSRSCSTSPQPTSCRMMKQTTIQADSHSGNSYLTLVSSNIHKSTNRRLSAPLIIHASTHPHHHHHHHIRQHRSAIVDENTEEALIFPLQRLSLSSTTGTSVHHNNSVNSLSTSTAGSANASPHNDAHSSSFNLSPSNSINLPSSLNNTSPASGTPPSQFVVGLSSSSPRASIPSNNSASPGSDRRMSLQTRGRRPSMFDPIDPKELQQALYASVTAKANLPTNPTKDEELNRAYARISISYERDSEEVFIDTLSFDNLQSLEGYMNNNSGEIFSFYCRFRLLPEKRSLFQTKIIRLSRLQSSYLFDNKQLNEFRLPYEQLNNHAVEILLYKISSIKPFYKDIRIASVKYDLHELSHSDQSRMRKFLEESDSLSTIHDPDLGELRVSLSYLQCAAKLSVVILEGKNLRPLTNETKSYPDACAKVTLYDRHNKRIKRKKTSVQRTSACPTFNEELIFELRRETASEITIEIRLVHESLSYKEQLGSVIFGPIAHNHVKGQSCPANVYWSTILSGESLNAQWQMLKPSIKLDESK